MESELKVTARPNIIWEVNITSKIDCIVVKTKITNTGRKHIYIKDKRLYIVKETQHQREDSHTKFNKNILHVDGDSTIATYEIRRSELDNNIKEIYIKDQKTDKTIYMPYETRNTIRPN